MAKKKSPKRKSAPRKRSSKRSPAGDAMFQEMCEDIKPGTCAAYAQYAFCESDDMNEKQKKAATMAVLEFAALGWMAYHNRPR